MVYLRRCKPTKYALMYVLAWLYGVAALKKWRALCTAYYSYLSF